MSARTAPSIRLHLQKNRVAPQQNLLRTTQAVEGDGRMLFRPDAVC